MLAERMLSVKFSDPGAAKLRFAATAHAIVGHRRCYQRAGVIQLPGTWAVVRLRLTTYLPIVEVLAEIRRAQPDRRVAIDLSRRWIRIWEP